MRNLSVKHLLTKVQEEKAKLEKYTQMMAQIKERLEALKAGR